MSNDKAQNKNVATVSEGNMKNIETAQNPVNAAQDKPQAAEAAEAIIEAIKSDVDQAAEAAEAAEANFWKAKASKLIAEAAEAAEAASDLFVSVRNGADLEKLAEAAEKVEALSIKAIQAAEAAEAVKATESERYAVMALYGDYPLVHKGDEKYVSSAQICISRYTRNTPSGYVSVLFYSPLSGDNLKPVGLISTNGVKRFSDVTMSDIIQAAIAKAESAYCEGLKEQRKADRLEAKLDKVSKAFASGSAFKRI